VASEFIAIKREFVEQVAVINPDDLKVLLVLLVREEAQENLKLGLTITELARQAGLSTGNCANALERLADQGLIRIAPHKNHREITISLHLTGRERSVIIPFSYDNKDEKKIENKEKEVRVLERELTTRRNKERSGIADTVQGEERNVIVEMESFMGRGFDAVEAYWLGQSVARFGPERVKQAFRKSRSARNLTKAITAMLRNKAFGQGAEQREAHFERGVNLREV
jgi:DNA-binding MarR family transcriptional regulator